MIVSRHPRPPQNAPRRLGALLVLAWLLSACTGPAARPVEQTASPAAALLSPSPTNTRLPSPSPSNTALPSPTVTRTLTPSPTQVPSDTPTPVPTYATLRGLVSVGQAVCHYGPGAPYLYKYGVYEGSNLEIIAIDEIGVYVEIQAIGGNNPCWVKAEYLKITGDMRALRPILSVDVKLPQSPYYGPLTGVSARRDGNTVTVFWHPLILRAGDDSLQTPYIVEAWVCRNGKLGFVPVGSRQTAVQIPDEAGCKEPSHGRVTAAEKHGYTVFVEVPWPQPTSP